MYEKQVGCGERVCSNRFFQVTNLGLVGQPILSEFPGHVLKPVSWDEFRRDIVCRITVESLAMANIDQDFLTLSQQVRGCKTQRDYN